MTIQKRRLHLEVTGRCNLTCSYCYNSGFNNLASTKTELSFKEQIMLIGQSIDIGCTSFCFSGGEPFLNPKIIDLIVACPESSRVSVITNASLLDDVFINRLTGLKQLRELKISLDGFYSHNNLRKGSSYEQILRIIWLVMDVNPQCKIIVNTMINKYSINELMMLYECLKTLRVKHWRIDMPFNSGRCSENSADFMDVTFRKIVFVYRELLVRYLKDFKPLNLEIFNVYKSQINPDGYYLFNDEVHPCAYYNDTVTVRPNGDLTYCPSLAFPVSNWRETRSLESSLRSAFQHKYFSLTLKQLSGCGMCRYFKICGGGCRADAITWADDELSPDPISCTLMPLIEKYIAPVLPVAERKMYEKLIDSSKNSPRTVRTAVELLR